MPPRKKQTRPVLDGQTESDLRAFCQVFYGANMTEVVNRAVCQFIEREVSGAGKQEEFEAVRRRVAGEPLQIVRDDGAASPKSSGR